MLDLIHHHRETGQHVERPPLSLINAIRWGSEYSILNRSIILFNNNDDDNDNDDNNNSNNVIDHDHDDNHNHSSKHHDVIMFSFS